MKKAKEINEKNMLIEWKHLPSAIIRGDYNKKLGPDAKQDLLYALHHCGFGVSTLGVPALTRALLPEEIRSSTPQEIAGNFPWMKITRKGIELYKRKPRIFRKGLISTGFPFTDVDHPLNGDRHSVQLENWHFKNGDITYNFRATVGEKSYPFQIIYFKKMEHNEKRHRDETIPTLRLRAQGYDCTIYSALDERNLPEGHAVTCLIHAALTAVKNHHKLRDIKVETERNAQVNFSTYLDMDARHNASLENVDAPVAFKAKLRIKRQDIEQALRRH